MGIPLIDHIIVGGDNHAFFSFREKGMQGENNGGKIY
ncbi:JAB domain-containing protein [Acetivibrio ethanolgignens]|nr:JAB domain-containing protein [Acetivibrio ethanolgignens]